MDAADRPAPRPLVLGNPPSTLVAAGHDPRIRMSDDPYKSWQCRTCGFIYDEAAAHPTRPGAGHRWPTFQTTGLS